MCLTPPSAWLSKVTQGPMVAQNFKLGASVSFLGLHVSVCTVEFSVYYTPPSCIVCGSVIQDTWAIRTLCDQPYYYAAFDRVKATTFVLLFGVGSFLCYKVFHHLRQRSRKPRKSLQILKEVDAESEISETSVKELCHSSDSFGDGEASTDSFSLTDCEEEDNVMGVSSSNHLEPVFFNKTSGIHFQRPYSSSPVDVLGESPHRSRCSWLEQSHDISFSYEGAASLRGNFSPGSLQERTRRTQEILESSGDEFYSDSLLPRYREDSATDSVVFYSEKCHPLHRQASVDSEEMGADLQKKVEAIGRATVQKMENLDLQLQELKQTVLELDADIVGLKVYRPPPQRCWELTNISSSSDNGSGVIDVIQHHWTKVWCKGLASPQFQQEEEAWNNVARSILDWDYVFENSADSGSDFGNSLDTDSVDPESGSVSGVFLEWDHSCLPEGSSADVIDAAITRKKKLKQISKSFSEDTRMRSFARQHRSMSIPPQMLAQQIKQVIKTPEAVTDLSSLIDGTSSGLAIGRSNGSSGESGFLDLKRLGNELPDKDVMKLSGLNWDSAYCEGTDELTTDSIGDAVTLQVFKAQIGWNDTLVKACEHLENSKMFSQVRHIKKDGYCMLRASLFQCLTKGISILGRRGSASTVTDLLIKMSQESCPWLNEWSFGGKLPYRGPEGFLDCMSTLQKLEDSVLSATSTNDCQERLTAALNSDSATDTKAMEALKLLMIIVAVELGKAGHNAPVFYHLLLAQLQPSWPLDRLDCVGGTLLEQAEFYLLGYTLSTTLKVVHLQRFGEEDFTCHYPECNLGDWPEIVVLSIDDNRCCVPVT